MLGPGLADQVNIPHVGFFTTQSEEKQSFSNTCTSVFAV